MSATDDVALVVVREAERLRALRDYDLLGSAAGESLDGCVELAAQICEVPVAMISLLDEACSVALTHVGDPVATVIPREQSFCSVAINESDLFEVPDAITDARFFNNPQTYGPRGVRFYAGVPLVTPEGQPLGMICVTDTRPRRLTELQRDAMRTLARHAADHLEQRQLARQLQDQNELLRLATDAVVIRDETGTVRFWNRGAEQLYGWSAQEVDGAPLDDLLQTRVDDGYDKRRRALAAGGSWEGELHQTTKYGREVVVHSRAVVKQDSHGSLRSVLELNTDVTADRRNAAKRRQLTALLHDQNLRLRELDRVKDDFIASISHEVHTPLASIRSYLEYLLDGDAGELSAEQRQCLTVVQRNSKRVLGLVDNLLSAANDAGTMRLATSTVDLCELVGHSMENCLPIARDRGIDLLTRDAGPVVVEADPDRLAEVVDNLISNALKFTPAGGTVEVRTGIAGQDGFIRVEDTGPGVADDEAPHLFDRFYRGARAYEEAVPGSGLGLSICKVIVEAHGGSLGVSSEPGRGATFWVELPLRQVPTNVVASPQRAAVTLA